ncbi:hypothetical protein [Clostridium estertheticum]|uniref:hypothetical protein n=1 Tax=Clostridium estertheticum TaxID=238834 RepID=UPI001C0B5F00|nr:hypothetical protein [Clostridium estertheticum]MBU3169896.1 hypothetical protein [Clostridium estertheticum]
MEKQQEYLLRTEIETFVLNKINSSLDKYYENYKDEIGFLLYYPLYYFEYDLLTEQQKLIEGHFKEGKRNSINLMKYTLPDLYKEKMKNLYAVSWFLKEMKKRQYKKIKKFTFDIHSLKEFRNDYNQIIEIYKDYISSMGLKKRRGISAFKLIELDENNYKLAEREIFDNISKEHIYFYGLHDDNFQDEVNECMKVDKYIMQKYNLLETLLFRKEEYNYMLERVTELDDNIDPELLSLCIDRVSIDIDKLGGNIESDIINDIEEYKKIIGYFYYISRVNLLKCINKQAIMQDFEKNLLLKFNYTDLVNRIYKTMNIDKRDIRKFLNYLSIDCEKMGGLQEFPLIRYNKRIVFSMTSFILNDFQFSITNGHKFKNIIYHNKMGTISKTSEMSFCEKAKNYSNILYSMEYNYNLEGIKTSYGEDMKSDIDFAMYDKESNCLLVIECKWKENFYNYNNENYVNILDSCDKIYKGQLKKHKEYLELDPNHINKLFEKNNELVNKIDSPKIVYVFVDKRIQYHCDGKHVISEYMLLYLMSKYTEGNRLKLKDLINEILEMKTAITYDVDNLSNVLQIGDKKIQQNAFRLNYNFNANYSCFEDLDFEDSFNF